MGSRAEQLDILRTTLTELPAAISRVDRRSEESRAPDGWSPREVLVHLADAELVYGVRLRLLDSLSEGEWGRTGRHTERGIESVEDQLVRMSDHDTGHLRQLQELR